MVEKLAEEKGVAFESVVIEGYPSNEIIELREKGRHECNHYWRCGTHRSR